MAEFPGDCTGSVGLHCAGNTAPAPGARLEDCLDTGHRGLPLRWAAGVLAAGRDQPWAQARGPWSTGAGNDNRGQTAISFEASRLVEE